MKYPHDEYEILTTEAIKWQVSYNFWFNNLEIIKVKKHNWPLEYTFKDGVITLKEEPKRKFKLTVIWKYIN